MKRLISLSIILFYAVAAYAAVTVTVNGSNHTIPETGEKGWGTNVTNWIQAISANTLQPSGGLFTLTNDVDFGATAGLKAGYYKSRASDLPETGVLRLGNDESIVWRNAANNGDIYLKVNSSDELSFNGAILPLSTSAVFQDSGFSLFDNSDNTKLLKFELSGITTETTRTITVPDADTTLVGTDTTQTLTNKAIDGDNNTLSNIAITALKTEVGDANKVVLRDGDGVIGSAKIVDANVDDAAAIARSKIAAGTADHVLINDASGNLSSEAVLAKSRGGAGADMTSVTFPSTGTIVTEAGTHTLTNKDIDGGTASNSNRITIPKNTKANLDGLTRKEATLVYATDLGKIFYDDGSTLKGIGGGGGGGIIPLLDGDNSNFESSIGDWVTYKDTAGAQPEDGTGGTATAITFTRVTDTPLSGPGSARFLTDGDADPQGEGASLDISVPLAMRGKRAMARFVYAASSGFKFGGFGTNSDVVVQLYDVTNSKLLNPYPGFLDGSGVYEGFFQIPSDCATVRLILHAAVSNATAAYALDIDEVQIDLAPNETHSSDSDWESWTPTGSWTTNVTYQGKFKKVGDYGVFHVQVHASGNVTAANLSINLPPGLKIDTSKLNSNYATSIYRLDSNGYIHDPGTLDYQGVFVSYLSDTSVLVKVVASGTSTTSSTVTNSVPMTWGNGDYLILTFRVPIVGWTSGNLTAASANLNAPVVFSAYKSGGSITANTTISSWTAVQKDTVGSFNSTTGEYTVKVPGDYYVSFHAQSSAQMRPSIRVNGTQVIEGVLGSTIGQVSGVLVNLKYGDVITVTAETNGTIATSTIRTVLSIHRIEASGRVYKTRVATVINAQPSGTGGGAWTHGSYQKLTLNTLSGDRSFLSISDSVITLQPGTYKTKIKGVGYRVGDFIVRLRDTTNNQTVVKGSGASSDSTDGNNAVSEGFDIFTITSAANFELQGYCASTNGTDGQGKAVSDGEGEVFAGIEFEKVL